MQFIFKLKSEVQAFTLYKSSLIYFFRYIFQIKVTFLLFKYVIEFLREKYLDLGILNLLTNPFEFNAYLMHISMLLDIK